MFKEITAATTEPVTTTELKSQLRITSSSQDTMLAFQIKAARRWAEEYLRYAIITSTWELYLDSFPKSGDCIYIQKSPVTSITSITYLDSDGDLQTWTSTLYVPDFNAKPCRIYEAYGESYPTTQAIRNSVVIKFVAGYAAAANVPDDIKQAILIKAATMYENPAEEVSGTQVSQFSEVTAKSLLTPYRALRF